MDEPTDATQIPYTEYRIPNTELLCFILYLHLHSDLVFHFHTLQSPVFDIGWLLFIPTSFHSHHSISYWLDIWCWFSVSYLYLCVFFSCCCQNYMRFLCLICCSLSHGTESKLYHWFCINFSLVINDLPVTCAPKGQTNWKPI